jgi:hypothetical protein
MAEEQIPQPGDQVISRVVLELITVANEYRQFLNKAEEYSAAELLGFLQKISPLIYLKSALLPTVAITDENSVEHFVTEEEWESLFNILRQKFDDKDQFYYVDLQEKSHQDAITGSLAECYTDIYQDLCDFILLYQKPLHSHKENAVAECKRLFETRYGYKLIIGQAAIHNILFPVENQDYDFI